MSTIIAKNTNGKIEMWSDTRILTGSQISVGEKVFIFGGMIIGVTGNMNIKNLLEFFIRQTIIRRYEELLNYITERITELSLFCKEHNLVEELQTTVILIGYRKQLYRCHDFCFSEMGGGYVFAGSGEMFAKALVLFANMAPEKTIECVSQLDSYTNDKVKYYTI